MIASLTLLPALLTIAGHKINDPFFPTLLGCDQAQLRQVRKQDT